MSWIVQFTVIIDTCKNIQITYLVYEMQFNLIHFAEYTSYYWSDQGKLQEKPSWNTNQ